MCLVFSPSLQTDLPCGMRYTSWAKAFKRKEELGYIFQVLDSYEAWRGGHPEPYPLLGNAVSKTALYTYWKVSYCWCLSCSPTSYSLWKGNMFTPRQAWPADKLLYSSSVLLCCWDLEKAMHLKFTFPSPGNPPTPSILGARTPPDYNCPSVPAHLSTTKKSLRVVIASKNPVTHQLTPSLGSAHTWHQILLVTKDTKGDGVRGLDFFPPSPSTGFSTK